LFPVPGAGIYELRGQLLPIAGEGLGLYVVFGDRGKAQHVLGLGGDRGEWEAFAQEFIVPRGVESCRLWIHSYNASRVTAYLDDLEVVLMHDVGPEYERDLAVVRQRLLDLCAVVPDPNEVRGWVATLNTDGAWPDIDYGDRSHANWKPAIHVRRLAALAAAYAVAGSELAGDGSTLEAALRALDHWYAEDYTCPNWWYNVIGVPMAVYETLLLLAPDLNDERMVSGLRVLERAELGMTGQNLVWVATITVARGCLDGDALIAKQAFDRIADEIRVTEAEGIQPDWSFHQHGPQLYAGGYGRGFAVDCARFARLARGTVFALPDEKIEILSGYVLDGQQWMVRGPVFDYSACGREITRKRAGSSGSVVRACRDLAALETERQAEFEACAARLTGAVFHPKSALSGNRCFWRSALMTHHRPGYFLSLRLTNPDLSQTEVCNDENLLGRHLSDGLTYLYRRGDEYRDIFPVWDWKRLPGTTVEQNDETPTVRNGERGQRSFSGGVSNGRVGLAAMDFARGDLEVRKAWFCVEDEIVCLGAGLHCSTDFPVETTLNQCLQAGPVTVAGVTDREPTIMVAGEDHRLEAPCWIHHDSVGYVIERGPGGVVRAGPQTGAWWRINRMYPDEPVTTDVFRAGILHGAGVAGGDYDYRILPGVSAEETAAHAREPGVQVWRNTAVSQVLVSADSTVLGAVFYEAGGCGPYAGFPAVEVSLPCLLLAEDAGDSLELTVACPDHGGEVLEVSLQRRLAGEDAVWDADAGVTRVAFVLPGGGLRGSSVSRQFASVGDDRDTPPDQ
jgi:chondroitin AC lyase